MAAHPKITGVRTWLYEVQLRRPISDANNPVGFSRTATLGVELQTDAGVSGLAFSNAAAKAQIHGLVGDLLIGRDPRGVRGHWKRMMDAVFKGGNRGQANAGLSALDVAMWDLKARLAGEPLWKTLGASTRKVRAYTSDIGIGLSDADLRKLYTGLAKQGVNAGKVKVGLDPEADHRRVGIMRDALAKSGKPPVLMIDSNEYWTPKQAIRRISALERDYDIFWAEEPARRWDADGLRKVGNGVRAAVASGENLDDISEFRPLFAAGAIDIANISYKQGGITGAMMIADLAYAHEVPVTMMNCLGHYQAHLAAALPNHVMMEVCMLGRGDGLIGKHPIEDGWITLSDRPGHGLEVDAARMTQLTVEAPSAAARAGSWGRRVGAALLELAPGEPEARGEE